MVLKNKKPEKHKKGKDFENQGLILKSFRNLLTK